MVDGGNIDVSVEGGSVHAVAGFFEFAGVLCNASPTTTNINMQSTNDNNPVNHQPIRHSKRLESQRCMIELDIKTPDTS